MCGLCGSALAPVGRLLGLRIEVSFVPIYKMLPLWANFDSFVRASDCMTMQFLELHR